MKIDLKPTKYSDYDAIIRVYPNQSKSHPDSEAFCCEILFKSEIPIWPQTFVAPFPRGCAEALIGLTASFRDSDYRFGVFNELPQTVGLLNYCRDHFDIRFSDGLQKELGLELFNEITGQKSEPGAPTVYEKPFQWRDRDGERISIMLMPSKRLFYTWLMIWNHSVPSEDTIWFNHQYVFDRNDYSKEYVFEGFKAMYRELLQRKDLGPRMREVLVTIAVICTESRSHLPELETGR